MGGTLDWTSSTNANEDSCKKADCSCATFFEIYQQVSIKYISNPVSINNYKLEPGYEARARRIASVYARIFLEKEKSGNKDLIGRFYWMGLGAFASKTMAMLFNNPKSYIGYVTNMGGSTDAIDILAQGNLWLFMDIAPWHLAWCDDQEGYRYCAKARNVKEYEHLGKVMQNLPWSFVLPTIKYLQETDEIVNAFIVELDIIEKTFKKYKTLRDKFRNAEKHLLAHLKYIAIQEQKNILQKICWDDPRLRKNVKFQRIPVLNKMMIDTTLVLSSEYTKEQLQQYNNPLVASNSNFMKTTNDSKNSPNKMKAELLKSLPESPWSTPPSNLQVEKYGDDQYPEKQPDSRMYWILTGAAPKYHRLMLDENGRQYLFNELETINSNDWLKFKANPKLISAYSNEGKT